MLYSNFWNGTPQLIFLLFFFEENTNFTKVQGGELKFVKGFWSPRVLLKCTNRNSTDYCNNQKIKCTMLWSATRKGNKLNKMWYNHKAFLPLQCSIQAMLPIKTISWTWFLQKKIYSKTWPCFNCSRVLPDAVRAASVLSMLKINQCISGKCNKWHKRAHTVIYVSWWRIWRGSRD